MARFIKLHTFEMKSPIWANIEKVNTISKKHKYGWNLHQTERIEQHGSIIYFGEMDSIETAETPEEIFAILNTQEL